MDFEPLGDRVIVRTYDAEELTAGGVVLPDVAQEKPLLGKVLAAGPGRYSDTGEGRVPLDVAVGDEVLYSRYGGTEMTVEDETFLVLRSTDILAKRNQGF